MDEILKKAAENLGMPPALAERSAKARAEKEGISVEAVLAEWAGEEAPPAPASSDDSGESAAPKVASEEGTPPTAPDSAPTEVTTDYLVALAADAKRMPEKLVRSSAEARARNSNSSVDAVLAAWAGVDAADLKTKAANGEALPVPKAAPSSPPEGIPAAPPPAAPADEPATPPAPPAAAAVAALSMDELLTKVSEVKGMPPALAKRSAEARAKKTGEPVEAVLAEWAGVDPAAVGSAASAAADAAVPAADEPPPPASAPAATAAAVGTLSMDELLTKVSEVKGMPPALAKRSAEARAKKTGEPVEAVLAEWAGVDVATVAAPSTAVADGGVPASPSTPVVDAAPPPAAAADDVEVFEAAASASAPDGASDDAEVPTRRSGYPTWLAAAFVLIPLLAVAYILVSPNGPACGTAGQLRIEESTGLAVNCDGSAYGSSEVNYLSLGAGIYAQCAACHGSNGEGGVGPAFAGGAVLTTFPEGQCSSHIEWVALGTNGFPDPTYGATNKPVGGGGVMPAFGAGLSEEELASVVLYERVTFGGESLDVAQVDCGLVEPADAATTQAAGE